MGVTNIRSLHTYAITVAYIPFAYDKESKLKAVMHLVSF